MSTVVFDTSMSLDGYMTAADQTAAEPLGTGGALLQSGPARRPVFVVTHEAPPSSPDGGVYRFVTDGIESALHLRYRVER